MSTVTTELRLAIAQAPVLEQVLREGARRMLQHAIEREVDDYLDAHAHDRDPQSGRRLVVRNGHLPPRELVTPLGKLRVAQPRVDDRRRDEHGGRAGFRFTSSILPKYLRKTRSVEELVPWLYLKGISSSDFPEALQALGLGAEAGDSGLSASSVIRMKELWRTEWLDWSRRSLEGKRYVYLWADGVYFNIRLEEPGSKRACVLVLMGATEDGVKELVAISEGHRESEMSWKELLLDLKSRGLGTGPEVAVGDGALGFWRALDQVYPQARQQRCWVHKTANVLNALPANRQESAKHALQQIWMAPTRAAAHAAFDAFVENYQAKYPKAAQCLIKDRAELLAFYDFPAEHWSHLRTTNPVESTFATVRLRTHKTKGCGTRAACLTMTFKLVQSAQRRWNRLKGSQLLRELIDGIRFVDGLRHAA
jgi:putative transposase